jgi:hypothetical protein
MKKLHHSRHKTLLVNVPAIKEPIQPSPGFAKKGLSDFKLDLMSLCQFGCSYCSSNAGNHLRINRERFANYTQRQLGQRLYPRRSRPPLQLRGFRPPPANSSGRRGARDDYSNPISKERYRFNTAIGVN